MTREVIEWRDAHLDPPQPGERVIARCRGFTGEAYMTKSGKWMRYPTDSPWETVFGNPVLEWANMPFTLPEFI